MSTPAQPSAPEVLFIAGWGRSGSTLLERLVGQHTGTASVGEMRDIWLRGVIEDRRCGCGAAFSGCPFWSEVGRVAFGGWDRLDVHRAHALRTRVDRPWTLPLLMAPRLFPAATRGALQEYAGLLRAVYNAVAAVASAGVIVDSTKIATHALILRRAGLDLRVVHLVRDSRGVMHSWQKSVRRPDSTGEADEMLRYGPVTGSVRYVVYNAYAGMLRRLRLPYLLLRYEDLVQAPADALARVVEHAGGTLDPGLAASVVTGAAPLAPTHTLDGNPMRLQGGPVRVRVDDAWQRDMPRRSRWIVSVLTGPLLRRYGYAVRTGGPTRAIGTTPTADHARTR